MQKAVTGEILWKKVLFKIFQNSQETPLSKEIPVSFAIFSRTLFYRTATDDWFWNADIAKTKWGKWIVFVVERWNFVVEGLLLWLKPQSASEASCHPAVMRICPTISHTCYPYLPDRWVLFLVPSVAEWNKEAGSI